MNLWKGLQYSLFSRTSIVVLEMIIISFLAFLNFAVVVRITSLETVGLWLLLSSILGISRAADIWSRGLSSYVAEARIKENDREAVSYVTTAAITGAAGYFIVVCVALPSLYFVTPMLVDEQYHTTVRFILPLMAIAFWLTSMSAVYQLGFLGFMAPGYKAVQTILGSLTFLILTIVLTPEYGIVGLIVAQIIQALFMLVFAIFIFHNSLAPTNNLQFWDSKKFKQLALFGASATGIGVLQMVTEPILRLLANYFGGLAFVSIIDFASRLIQVARNIVGSIGQNLIPSFASQTNFRQNEQARYFRVSMDVIFCLSVACLTIAVGISPLVGILVLDLYNGSAQQFTSIFAIGWLTNLLVSPAYFLLFGRRQVGILLKFQLIMLLGMIGFGTLGGFFGGLTLSLLGAMTGVIISSVYLIATVTKMLFSIDNIVSWFTPRYMLMIVPLLCSLWIVNVPIRFMNVGALHSAIIIGFLTTLLAGIFFPYRKFFLMLSELDKQGAD
ncbi:hypothetical protein [Parasphingorhabdus sp.]|uniref:hypothetical protein n=1 Tax=Parasphingorhabdus sp. TaxID=2709688 RepID=UPI0030038F4D